MKKKYGTTFSLRLKDDDLALVRKIQEKHPRSIGKLFVQFLKDFDEVLTNERAKEIMFWIVSLSIEENRKRTFLEAYDDGGLQETIRDIEVELTGWAEIVTKDGQTFFAEHDSMVPLSECEEFTPTALIEDRIPDICMIRGERGISEQDTINSFVEPLFKMIWKRGNESEKEAFIKLLKGKIFYLYKEEAVPNGEHFQSFRNRKKTLEMLLPKQQKETTK